MFVSSESITEAGRQWRLYCKVMHRRETQGVAREPIAIPATSATPAISAQAYGEAVRRQETLDALRSHSRVNIGWRVSKRLTESLSASETPVVRVKREKRPMLLTLVDVDGAVSVTDAQDWTFTSDARKLVKAVRDVAVRETLTHEERETLAQHVAAVTTDGKEGMTAIRETRVNVRGAYGKRGVKVVPAKRVTRRDNTMPAELLKPIVTVGHATTPERMTRAQVTEVMETLRRDPARSAVRVITSDGRNVVRPVADYGLVTERKPQEVSGKRTVVVAERVTLTSRLSDGAYAKRQEWTERVASQTQAGID